MDNFNQKPVNRLARPANAPQGRPVQPLPQRQPIPGQPQPFAASPEPRLEQPQPLTPQQPVVSPQPIEPAQQPPKKKRKKALIWTLIVFVVIILATLGAAFVWYSVQTSPVDATNDDKVLVTIPSGTSPTGIAELLKEQDLIRNTNIFLWYTRLQGVQNSLQAGSYRLSPSESLPEIVTHLTKGTVDTFDITFIPGQTLRQSREVLLSAGYSAAEVDEALSAQYDSPLFDGRPAGADLEGYIYPDTYRFGAGATVKDILTHIFDTFNQVIVANDLKAKYQAQNLSLFQGITMASIIQKEAVGGDERQIAQVFLKRYAMGMMLGSDPTYQYITDKRGVPRDLNYDSPYNTRRYVGIPPGPIANSNLTVLKAVADPAPGDFLYFLSGDDDVTYFSMTFEEHERNIAEHCKIKCQAL